MQGRSLIFLILVAVSASGQIISDLYLPALPAMAEYFHSSVHAAQFSLSIYFLGFGISQLFYGPISDAIGRRKPLLLGMFLCLIGSVICYEGPNIHSMCAGRFLQGLGAGATLTLSSAIFRDLFENEMLAKYGSYSALIGAGLLATAPLFGGYLQACFGWHADFMCMIVISIITLLAVFYFVGETNSHQNKENLQTRVIKQNLQILFTSPLFIGYSACSLFTYGAILSWLTAGPVLLQTALGLNPVTFGWGYVLTGIAFAVGAIINSRYVTRFGIQKMLGYGLGCVALSGFSLVLVGMCGYVSITTVITSVMVLLFGASLVFPNCSAGIFQPFPQIAGIASAVFYSSRLLGGAIFSGILALLPAISPIPMGMAILVSAILSLIMFRFTK